MVSVCNHVEKNNGKKNNNMDVSSDKQAKSYTTSLGKGNFKRETEFLQRAAQNNAIRTMSINKTQQNSRCRSCGDRDKTINQIISEYSKLTQKEYKTKHDCVGKVIHRE